MTNQSIFFFFFLLVGRNWFGNIPVTIRKQAGKDLCLIYHVWVEDFTVRTELGWLNFFHKKKKTNHKIIIIFKH